MKKTMGARVLSLLLSCVLLGTMLPAAVASADPTDPTYSITVAPPSIDLVEGDEGELTAKVVSESMEPRPNLTMQAWRLRGCRSAGRAKTKGG